MKIDWWAILGMALCVLSALVSLVCLYLIFRSF